MKAWLARSLIKVAKPPGKPLAWMAGRLNLTAGGLVTTDKISK